MVTQERNQMQFETRHMILPDRKKSDYCVDWEELVGLETTDVLLLVAPKADRHEQIK